MRPGGIQLDLQRPDESVGLIDCSLHLRNQDVHITLDPDSFPVQGADRPCIQVLFLKHNPNARALASLKSEAGSIEDKVGRLIEEMEAEIAKADRFISAME